MSRPTTVAFGRDSSTPTPARPDPAPAASTRPDPDARKRDVGGGTGALRRNTRCVTRKLAIDQTATIPARAVIHRGHLRQSASATMAAEMASGIRCPLTMIQL